MFLLSIKQLFRTPLKALLFILLLSASTTLLVFGSVLLIKTNMRINQVEDTFTTIGMVSQLPSSTETVVSENGCDSIDTASYDFYDELVTLDMLDFEGANYIVPPENRVCYIASPSFYNESTANKGIRHLSTGASQWGGLRQNSTIVAEIIPLYDSLDGQPVQARTGRVLFGSLHSGQEINFCPHHSAGTAGLEKGKKYMACMKAELCVKHDAVEYVPMGIPYSSEYGMDGTTIKDGVIPNFHYFRQTPEGAWVINHEEGGSPADLSGMQIQFQNEEDKDFSMDRWEEWAGLLLDECLYYPIIAVNDLDLLPSFHSGNIQIMTGRSITQEEFSSGAKVCLIPDGWTYGNKFAAGDSILTLPLSVTLRDYPLSKFNSADSSSFFQPYSFFDKNGEQYSPFFTGDYEVVGTYYIKDKSFFGTSEVELTTSTIIIPANSVTAPDVNLAYSGPLRSTNVSFKIPNGSIAEFDKKLREAVPQAEMLDITYDDNGYEVIMPSLKRTQVAAVLLCGIGGAALLAVIIFLLYFFIAKEARRTAIERGLGMSRRQCYISLVSGILVLALAGAVLGTGLGLAMIGRSDLKSNENEEGMYSVYSTQYSDWTSKWSQTMEFIESDVAQPPLMPIICAIPGGLVLAIFLLAMVMVRNNLKAEPIELLGGR